MADEDLRLAIYHHFAAHGTAPSVAQLVEKLHQAAPDIHQGLQRLASARHIVLAADGSHSIIMAHPFSAVPLGFSVMGKRTLWWGGCAWDSFALPHVLPDDDSAHRDTLPRVRPRAGLGGQQGRAAGQARGGALSRAHGGDVACTPVATSASIATPSACARGSLSTTHHRAM